MNTFSAPSSFPPSLAHMPILTMLTQMGFWIVTLLCLQWIYSILDDANDHPAPRGSYVGTVRTVKLRLLLCAVLLTAPRLVLLAAWGPLSVWWREAISLSAWLVLIPASIVLSHAWWRDREARPSERLHLRHRFVEIAPATAHEKTRGAIALVLIIVIAFATTFIRLDPRDVPVPPATVERR
jgi:hypothetical protein